MDKKFRKAIIFLGIFFALLLKAGFVFALEVEYPTFFGISVNDTSTIATYICYFFGIVMNIAISIALLSIVFGGIYYLVDYARGKFKEEGKEWIKAGITGLLIATCASLIIYTINPQLATCKMGILSLIPSVLGPTNPSPINANFTNYQEIPMGVLTENLLSNTMGCYTFDPKGNPVDYASINKKASPITDDDGSQYSSPQYFIPEYLNHDRADCLLQLIDGAQKKGQVIAELSSSINKLMNTCSCQEYGHCGDTCGGQDGCDNPDPAGDGSGCNGTCTGACVGAACKNGDQPDCCPSGVKDKIEHGPVDVGGCGAGNDNPDAFYNKNFHYVTAGLSAGIGNIILAEATTAPSDSGCCDFDQVTYDGLDEFRCPNPISDATYASCDNVASFVEKQITINKKTVSIIDQKKWAKLNLVQQLSYFKEKISALKQEIQNDENALDSARGQLSRCYLAVSYIDLLKAYKSSDQQANIILTQKFLDQQTGQPVSAQKYCKGFNYNNSSCMKKCNDECPDSSQDAMKLYSGVSPYNGNDAQVLDSQEVLMEKAYNSRPCPYKPDGSNYNNYANCISSCQNDCSNDCSQKYLPCSGEYQNCQSLCTDNSSCALSDNPGACLFGPGAQGFTRCASQFTDNGNSKYCINGAYMCKNGSDEYAGYADCATKSNTGACSGGNNSASFFYDHPECLKCASPANQAPPGTACYSDVGSCQETCPETSKCPASSNCPDCPCDQVDQTLEFSIMDPGDASGQINTSTAKQKVSAHEIVGAQCNEYAFNDDPLTFYCQQNWWKDPNREGQSDVPIGNQRDCPVAQEIPVGKTVDDSENWANEIIQTIDNETQIIQQMIAQMKKAGDAKDTSPVQNYCKCDAKFDTSEPICTTKCQYGQALIPVLDADGNPTGATQLTCSCTFTPCNGSPCQQVINYLSELWNYYNQLKGSFMNFYTSMVQEPRSDIMKELEYSRQTAGNASDAQNNFGNQARMLDCTRAEDEKIPAIINNSVIFGGQPIKHYCYGTALGKLFDVSLTDNWFYCNLQKINNNPQK